MALDFKSLVNSGRVTVSNPNRTLVNLNNATPVNTWSNLSPNTASGSIKSALAKIRNAPVSTDFWNTVKQGFVNVIQKPAVQFTLDTLDVPRNAVFNQISNWTDGSLNWNDLPIVGLYQGAKGSYSPEGKITTETFLNRYGIQGTEGRLDPVDVMSFVGDTLLDPTTYLTFGAGSVAKAAASGVAKEAAQSALEAGLREGLQQGSRQLDDFVASTLEKAARAKANNQLIGFNIPFGPEVTLANKFGPLKVKSQNISGKVASDLHTRFTAAGLGSNAERYDFVSKIVGRPIQSFKELNTQEFDHIWKLLDSGLDQGISKIKNRQVDELLNPSVTDDVTQSINDMFNAAPTPRTSDALNNLAERAGRSFQYFEGADGMSAIGKALKGSKLMESIGSLVGGRRYVAPSVIQADHRIKDAVDVIEDARLGGFAKSRAAVDRMEKLVKSSDSIKQLTPEELKMMPYLIEGKWPQGMRPEDILPERLELMTKAADDFRSYLKEFTDMEQAAGVKYKLRENYFPHIMDIPNDGEDFKALVDQLRTVNEDLAMKLEHAPKGFTRERKMFDSMADVTDFVNNLRTKIEDPNTSVYERSAAEKLLERFGNTVYNPIEAYSRRAMSGAHEVAKMQSYRQLQKLGVAKTLEPGKAVPAGWRKIDIHGLENSIVPDEVYRHMQNIEKIMVNDVAMRKWLKRWNEAYTIWRRNATVVSPGFHIRQMIGNLFQNTLAGVTPKAYNDAVKVLSGKGSIKIGRQELTAERIMEMAMEDGIIGTGSSTDFLTTLSKELGARADKGNIIQKLNPLGEQFALGQLGRKGSELEDNFARIAHYIYVLQKGGTRKMAKESVIKYLFDYSNLTGFERSVMRTLMPFYAWMRNNVPFQIAQAVKRPGLYQVIDDLQEIMQQEPEVDPLLDELGINRPDDRQNMHDAVEQNGGILPSYIRERYINVGGNNYFNLSLPSSDLAMLSHPVENILQSFGPWWQYPSGLATNRNSFGAPIDPYDTEGGISPLSSAGIRYTLDQLGGFPGRALGMGLGNIMPNVVAPTSVNDRNPLEQIGRLMFGVTQVDPLKQLEGILYRRANEATAEKKRQKRIAQ